LKGLQIPNMKIHPVGAAFCTFANMPNSDSCVLDDRNQLDSQQVEAFLFFKVFGLVVWSNQLPVQCEPVVQLLSLPPYPDKVKNAWSLCIGSTYALMRCTRTTFITTRHPLCVKVAYRATFLIHMEFGLLSVILMTETGLIEDLKSQSYIFQIVI